MALLNKDKLPIKYTFGIYEKHKDYPTLYDNLYELFVMLDEKGTIEFSHTEVTSAFIKRFQGMTRDEVLLRLAELGFLKNVTPDGKKKLQFTVIRNPWQ